MAEGLPRLMMPRLSGSCLAGIESRPRISSGNGTAFGPTFIETASNSSTGRVLGWAIRFQGLLDLRSLMGNLKSSILG